MAGLLYLNILPLTELASLIDAWLCLPWGFKEEASLSLPHVLCMHTSTPVSDPFPDNAQAFWAVSASHHAPMDMNVMPCVTT